MSTQSENHGHHISQQFNVELEDIKKNMMEMGGAVEKQLSDAAASVVDTDSRLAEKVINGDDDIDAMEVAIDEQCSLILARRQPAASDLRLVLAIIKAVRDLERIGDESSKIARMAVMLSEEGEFPEGFVEFRHLANRVATMVNQSLDAFARYDAEEALKVAEHDREVDREYGSAMRSMITYMMADHRSITRVLNLLWALRALERIGDHAKNIAESVIYVVKGTDVRHEKLEDVADKIAEEGE
ncbi:MAG: phosphate signaling complex protein PhoU [Pseudohongiellaceae bacterium]|jgi:phosphate transport system protein